MLILRAEYGEPQVPAPAQLAYNGSPRRNEGQPDVSASGALPPNPRKGRLPLDPAVLFSWSTGESPPLPPRQRRSRPTMTPDTGGGGPQPPIPAIQVEADRGRRWFLRRTESRS